MSQFDPDDKDHREHFALLFDSHKVEEKFKDINCGITPSIIKDKEETRISNMIEACTELGSQGSHFQRNAITRIIFTKSHQESLAVHLGVVEMPTTGVMLCPRCLDKAILSFEEHLQTLKDLREATKAYATANG